MRLYEVDNPEALQGQDMESLCKELPYMEPDDPRRIDIGIATAGSRHAWSDIEGSPIRPMVRSNALWYCAAHEREICAECNNDQVVGNSRTGFTIPDNNIPEYPRLLMDSCDWQLVRKVYARWLDLQKTLNPGARVSVSADLVQLPDCHPPDPLNDSAVPLQVNLLQRFHQLQGMATTQRYYFANQAKILLEDYDTFRKAAVLYEEGLADWLSENSRICEDFNYYEEFMQASARTTNLEEMLSEIGLNLSQSLQLMRSGILRPYDKKLWPIKKAKASIVNTFGFFLGLNTIRSFWRAIELTAGAFVLHLEKYDESVDCAAVMTEKAKASLLQCLAHVFWSLQYAQHRMDQLRALQHQVYQRREFPFYPVQVKALKAGVDIHLIIAKLSKVPMYNFPLVSSLLSAFEQASQFKNQMLEVNAELMASYDELSTRYRVIEVLLGAARLVASEAEIKASLETFKFEPAGQDVTSMLDHVTGMLEGGHYNAEVVLEDQVTPPMTFQQALQSSMAKRVPASKKPSFFQRLLGTENALRHTHAGSFMHAPILATQAEGVTPDAFNAFKAQYLKLYDSSIRQRFKQEEQSLLPLDVARRFQHRKDVAKKKKRSLAAKDRAIADIAECRDVPQTTVLDPSLFWAVGDGRTEKYVCPVIHEKVKTRKLPEGKSSEPVITDVGSETADSSFDSSTAGSSTPRFVQLPVDQLKQSDLTTRDILWRKVKGTLKWSNLMQLLTRLGCWILNLDGSKRKVVDPRSGRCTVLHMPHPGDECRPDQRDSYRLHIEDWLNIHYSEILGADEIESTGDPNAIGNVSECRPSSKG